MGRASIHAYDKTKAVKLGQSPSQGQGPKLYLRRIRLDSGGYDENGTYFGIGTPLYWVADSAGEIDFVLRSHNREIAKKDVRERYPNARFYR